MSCREKSCSGFMKGGGAGVMSVILKLNLNAFSGRGTPRCALLCRPIVKLVVNCQNLCVQWPLKRSTKRPNMYIIWKRSKADIGVKACLFRKVLADVYKYLTIVDLGSHWLWIIYHVSVRCIGCIQLPIQARSARTATLL